ncbi:MAG: hypothetical protein IT168_08585 [Bryobacterales bacterium]|nr:hypothetical protein [Bryobacterales bacterium]
MTEKQIEASRLNGAKSRGPVSIEGRSISSQNATTHGLNARRILLKNESVDEFNELLQSNYAQFLPQTPPEMRIVEEYSVAEWRVRRAWSLISALVDNNSDKMAADIDSEYASIDEVTRTALAHDFSLPNTHSIRELESHVARYSRQCDRALRRLKDMRSLTARKGAPNGAPSVNEGLPTPGTSPVTAEKPPSNKNTENEPG